MGTLTTGNGAGKFLIAGPDWNGEKRQGMMAEMHKMHEQMEGMHQKMMQEL